VRKLDYDYAVRLQVVLKRKFPHAQLPGWIEDQVMPFDFHRHRKSLGSSKMLVQIFSSLMASGGGR
jgi:hypothetical protein